MLKQGATLTQIREEPQSVNDSVMSGIRFTIISYWSYQSEAAAAKVPQVYKTEKHCILLFMNSAINL